MSSFTTPLRCEDLDDGRRQLLEPFTYYSDASGGRVDYTVPAGFVSDGASIPRILWPLIGSPWGPGPHGKAAVLHDWLYATAPVSRARADRLFLEALEVLGIGWLKRWTLYTGVRSGGWVAWNSHRRRCSLAS